MNNLQNWQYLQKQNYFANHRCYSDFHLATPAIGTYNVHGKIIVEIGCGYGRETVWFSNHAKLVYAIDVSDTIIQQARKMVTLYGNSQKVIFLLSTDMEKIPNNIDIIYSVYVFQHLTPEQTKNYIDTLYQKLEYFGQFIAHFRMGKKQEYYPDKQEPLVIYPETEIINMFKKYTVQSIDTKIGQNYQHLYITAIKEA